MKLEFYNTLHRKVEEFTPIHENGVGLYTCGPTVYNYAHIGNLRTYVFEDLLRRTLEYAGYTVNHVMNVTDVGHLTDDADEGEDKMLKSAREKKQSVWDIAQFYTDAFFNDVDKLNIKRPSVTCRATEHIDDMINLVKRIEENGFTYTAGGNVYFSIDKYPDYGKMALLDKQDLQAGSRIEVDSNKKNPHDFVLWFTKSKFENQVMVWDSPWGKGYPGWHLECSAMSMKYLGEHFDIHCGGVDHISVHHTNEIAQSEAATGKKWVNYWLHGEFLLMETGKMSKSKDNFLTLEKLIEAGYDALDYRFFLLGAHYKTQLIFHFDALDAAKKARNNLNERIIELKQEIGTDKAVLSEDSRAKEYVDRFFRHMANNLNAPRALSELWTLMKDKEIPASQRLAAVLEMDEVLGLRLSEIEPESEISEEMKALIHEREQARADKNFQRADEIRDILAENNIIIRDTPKGTEWKITKNM